MNPSSVDIVSLLEDESSLGLTFATNLFVGHEPSKPTAVDNCVTVYDTAGYPPHMGLTDYDYYYPSIQIRVRNRSYITGYELAQDIMVALHGRNQETVNDTLYTSIKSLGDPAFLDWDDKQRAIFVVNFNIQRREV